MLVGDLFSEHPRVARAAVKHLKPFWSAGDESYDWPPQSRTLVAVPPLALALKGILGRRRSRRLERNLRAITLLYWTLLLSSFLDGFLRYSYLLFFSHAFFLQLELSSSNLSVYRGLKDIFLVK